MSVAEVEKAVAAHPDARAILVNNPTYYGICSDVRSIVKIAHDHGMLCLADEAHGTHLYFHEDLPVGAIAAGRGHGRRVDAQIRRQPHAEQHFARRARDG